MTYNTMAGAAERTHELAHLEPGVRCDFCDGYVDDAMAVGCWRCKATLTGCPSDCTDDGLCCSCREVTTALNRALAAISKRLHGSRRDRGRRKDRARLWAFTPDYLAIFRDGHGELIATGSCWDDVLRTRLGDGEPGTRRGCDAREWIAGTPAGSGSYHDREDGQWRISWFAGGRRLHGVISVDELTADERAQVSAVLGGEV